jgi:hypothetical protein
VGELIAAAGGEVIFPELRNHSRAPDWVVTGDEILASNRTSSSQVGAASKPASTGAVS